MIKYQNSLPPGHRLYRKDHTRQQRQICEYKCAAIEGEANRQKRFEAKQERLAVSRARKCPRYRTLSREELRERLLLDLGLEE